MRLVIADGIQRSRKRLTEGWACSVSYSSTFTEESRSRFYQWRTEVTEEMKAQLSKDELMEIAYRSAYQDRMQDCFHMMQPLADPRLALLAEALQPRKPAA